MRIWYWMALVAAFALLMISVVPFGVVVFGELRDEWEYSRWKAGKVPIPPMPAAPSPAPASPNRPLMQRPSGPVWLLQRDIPEAPDRGPGDEPTTTRERLLQGDFPGADGPYLEQLERYRQLGRGHLGSGQ
jgi:hypothetical protein